MMKRTQGMNVKKSVDPSGGFVSVDWNCPYCNNTNIGLYFSSLGEIMMSDFELDHECEWCGKMVAIECIGSDPLFHN